MEHHLQEKIKMYGQLSSYFIRNEGQLADERVYYYAEGSGYGVYFTDEGVQFVWNRVNDSRTEGLRLDFCFLNEGQRIMPKGMSPLAGKMNYFSGNGIQQQHTNVSTYEEIVYKDVWAGIDLVFKIEQGKMKYEFLLQPYVDVATIRFTYKGVDGLSIDADGNLVLDTPFGEMIDTHPISYHVQADKQVKVESAFQLQEEDMVIGFVVGKGYDERLPLVIDPEIVYSTFFVPSDMNVIPSFTVDQEGCAYMVGSSEKNKIPVTTGAIKYESAGEEQIFVSKLNQTGTALIYSAILGGGYGYKGGRIGVVVDEVGCTYVAGSTELPGSFPTSPGAHQETTSWGEAAFITKINPTGSGLIYSTFLTGPSTLDPDADLMNYSYIVSIDIDDEGNAYGVGFSKSKSFPTSPGAYEEEAGDYEAWAGYPFIIKMNETGTGFVFSTFFTGVEEFTGIKVYKDGTFYVSGSADGEELTTTDDAYIGREENYGERDFVTKFNKEGTGLVYSTFVSPDGDALAKGLAIDDDGCAYIMGSMMDGTLAQYVTKLNEAGTDVVYRKILITNDEGDELYEAIAVDSYGQAYVIGLTERERRFPTTQNAFSRDAEIGGYYFITKLDQTGEDILFSTFFGGEDCDGLYCVVVDNKENVYVLGSASGKTGLLITPNAYNRNVTNSENTIFLTKISTGPMKKLKRLGCINESFCDAFTIQNDTSLVQIWLNKTNYRINGTIVVENKGGINGWSVEVLINQFIGGEARSIIIMPGMMQSITIDELMTINIQGTENEEIAQGAVESEVDIEVYYTLNW